MKKLTLILGLFLILSLLSDEAFANNNAVKHEQKADELKQLGLFQGTTKGYELDRAPTRVEGIVMLIRLLGKEDEALKANLTHPFNDVPAWASHYVAYAYHHNLSKGLDQTTFGSSDHLTVQQYATFILRALGYDDAKGDFKWSNAVEKMNELGIISATELYNLKSKTFLRDDTVLLSYQGLYASMKNGEVLIEHLNLKSTEVDSKEESAEQITEVIELDAAALPEFKLEVESYAFAKAYIFPEKLGTELKDLKTFTAVKYNLLIDAERFIQSLTNPKTHDTARKEIEKFKKNTSGSVKDSLLSSNLTLYPHEPGKTSSYGSSDPAFDTYVVLVFENHNDEIFAYSTIHVPYNSVTDLLEDFKAPVTLSDVPEVTDMYLIENHIAEEQREGFIIRGYRYYHDKAKYDDYITKYGKPVFTLTIKTPTLLNDKKELSYNELKNLDVTKSLFKYVSKYPPASWSSSNDYNYQYELHLDANMKVMSYAVIKLPKKEITKKY